MKSKYLLIALAVLSASALCSCEKEELQQEVSTPVQNEERHLVNAELKSSVPVTQAVNELKTKLVEITEIKAPVFQDIDLSKIGIDLVAYRIEYRTKDNSGNDITLSGDVAFIANRIGKKRILESISLFHQAFSTDEGNATEYEQYAFPGRSIHNALVVYPHYQGAYAGRRRDLPVTFAELLLKARQGIDCLLAAIEFIDTLEDVELSPAYYTENMGISCGSGTALATQYLLERDPGMRSKARKVRLASTYCCEGCYSFSDLIDMITTFYPNDSQDDPEDLSLMEEFKPACLLGLIVGTYDTWKGLRDAQGKEFFEGVDDVSVYFSKEFRETKFVSKYTDKEVGDIFEYFREGKLNAHDNMFRKAGFLSSNMMNPEMIKDGKINKDDSRIAALLHALKQNEVIKSGWCPMTPLCISHSLSDEFVPYSQAFEVYDNLSHHGLNPNVHMKTLPLVNHTEGNVVFAVLDIILSKHPVD